MKDLIAGGLWQSGPEFLKKNFPQWPVKLDFRTDRLDGEILPKEVHVVFLVSEDTANQLNDLLLKSSDAKKLFRSLAYGFQWRLTNMEDCSSIKKYALTPKRQTYFYQFCNCFL